MLAEPIAAPALVHLDRGATDAALEAEVERELDAVAAELPRTGLRVGLVLDASASTRGYGEREYA